MSPEDLPSAPAATIEVSIDARTRDIGGLTVGRLLPSPRRRTVGPFVFFDRIGPVTFEPGQGVDVRPHPHINLATVTYLFEGEIDHRDSLGVHQTIQPGAINLMVAGRGITHSERSGPEVRASGGRLSGIQLWLALPESHEQMEPAFEHHPAESLRHIDRDGATLRVLLGEVFGVRSPASSFSPMLYAEARMRPGSRIEMPFEYSERAIYVASGSVLVRDEVVPTGRLVVFGAGELPALRSSGGARVMVLAGEPVGPRHMFWNFVSSSKERIEQAKRDWAEGRFPTVPGDEEEFVPLPE